MTYTSFFSNRKLLSSIIIVSIFIIAFVAILGHKYFSLSKQNTTQTATLNVNENMTVPQKKDAILVRVNSATTTPLTADEKAKIRNELGGSKVKKFNLTQAEEDAILKAVNAR